MWTLVTVFPCQMDAFCLRERDLLSRFVMKVSQHQAEGQSKDYALMLVRTLLFYQVPASPSFSLLFSNCGFQFPTPELSACWRLGKSILRSSNVANLYWYWGNYILRFFKGKYWQHFIVTYSQSRSNFWYHVASFNGVNIVHYIVWLNRVCLLDYDESFVNQEYYLQSPSLHFCFFCRMS